MNERNRAYALSGLLDRSAADRNDSGTVWTGVNRIIGCFERCMPSSGANRIAETYNSLSSIGGGVTIMSGGGL